MTVGAPVRAHRPSDVADAEDAASPRRHLLPIALFLGLALAFCAPALVPGRIFMPTNPTWFQPWVNDAAVGEPGGRSNGLMGDALIFTLPGRVWNHEMLSRGQVPLWNPFVFAGYPHLGLIQNNALYPLSAPFDLVAPMAGLAWSAVLHLFLAGTLMYAFLRGLGLTRSAAAVGGVAFELNGMFLVRISAPSYVYSGVWLPLLLLGAHSIATGRARGLAAAVLLGTTLSVLGGHPQITSLALMLSGAYLVFQAWGRGALVRACAWFAASAVLGVGLAGFQVVPFLELVRHSAREMLSLEAYRAAALPPMGLLQALVPDVFGNPVERTYWFAKAAHLLDGVALEDRFWAHNYSGGNLFTGVAPLFLSAVALLRSPRRRVVVFFALAATASLGVLVGSPLLDLAYLAVPGFRHSRPDRVAFVYMAAVAILSALGGEALASAEGATTRRKEAAWITAAAAFILAWPLLPRILDGEARADLGEWARLAAGHWREQAHVLVPEALVAVVVIAGAAVVAVVCVRRRRLRGAPLLVLLALIACPSLWFGWSFNPSQREPRFGMSEIEHLLVERAERGRIARLLVDAPQFLPANVSQLVGLRDVSGASAAGVASYLGLIAAADPGAVAKQKYFRSFETEGVARTPLLDALAVRLLVSDENLGPPWERIASVGSVYVYENRRSLPRFRVVGRYEIASVEAEARARLLAPEFPVGESVLLSLDEATRADAISILGAPRALTQSTAVVVERDEPTEIVLRVDAPEGGALVVSDAFYPGWEARVDGEPREVLRANAAFRAVALAPGSHRVEMSFRPASLRAGIAVSLGSLGVVALLSWGRRRRTEAEDAARSLVRTGVSLAVLTAWAVELLCPGRDALAAAPDLATAYAVQLHVHGSASEGAGSVDSHSHEATGVGADVIWWSDHDFRIATYRHASRFGFEDWSEPLGRDEPWASTGDDLAGGRRDTKRILEPASPALPGGSAEITRDAADEGERSFRVRARRPGGDWAPHLHHIEASRGLLKRPLFAGVTVRLSVLSEKAGPDARPVVEIGLSEHAPREEISADEVYRLVYVLESPPGKPERRGSAVTIPIACEPGIWNRLELRVTEDAMRHFPAIRGDDNSLAWIAVGVEVRRDAEGAALFDRLRIEQETTGEATFRRQSDLIDAVARGYPRLRQLQGSEISWVTPHLNEFSVETRLVDYDALAGGGAVPAHARVRGREANQAIARGAVEQVHARGGLVSYNHMFGAVRETELPRAGTPRETQPREHVLEELLANRLLGADLLEVGYRHRGGHDLVDHLWVWDELGRRGLHLVGTGVSDSHGGPEQRWRTSPNNFLSWIYARSPEKRDLIEGMRAGRVFFGDIVAFDGTLDLASEAGHRMGRIVLSDRAAETLAIEVDGATPGDWIDVVRSGARVARFPVESASFRAKAEVALAPAEPTVVRIELRSHDGAPKAFGNPISFVRSVPEGGIEPARAAIDLGGLRSAGIDGFRISEARSEASGSPGSESTLTLVGTAASGSVELVRDRTRCRVAGVDLAGLVGESRVDGERIIVSRLAGQGAVRVRCGG